MTTMPPEMSTVTTPTSVNVPSTKNKHRDSFLVQQSSRSRFMITDILAGSAVAATAVLRTENKAESAAKLLNSRVQCTKNTNKHSGPHHSHGINQTTSQQYSTQHNQHLFQHQQSHFTGSIPYQQQHLAIPSNAHQILASEIGQRQESSLPPSDFISNLHAVKVNSINMTQPTRYTSLHRLHQNLNDMNTETPADKVGKDAMYCGIYHDDRSRSPLPASQIEIPDFNVQTDPGKVIGDSGISGGSISGDQASTIDESDSDTCGGRDEDAYSSKSEALMGLSKKQRKARTAFTDHQLQTLEKTFERQKYLSVQDRMELANKLELSDCQVKTWYQNRRTKWKRQTAVGLELLAEAGNYAAFQRLYGNTPYLSAWPYAAQPTPSTPANAIDMYFRQAAAAAVLQKPISYRMYPSVPPMSGLSSIPMPPASFAHLNASNPLSTLSSYYHTSAIAQHSPKNTNISIAYAANPQLNSDLEMSRRSDEIGNIATIPQLNSEKPTEHMGELPSENESQFVDDDDDIDDDDIEV